MASTQAKEDLFAYTLHMICGKDNKKAQEGKPQLHHSGTPERHREQFLIIYNLLGKLLYN